MITEHERQMWEVRRHSETEKWVRSLDASEIAEAYLCLEDELEVYRNACAGIPTEQLEAGCVEKLVEALQRAFENDNLTYSAREVINALAPFQKDKDQ